MVSTENTSLAVSGTTVALLVVALIAVFSQGGQISALSRQNTSLEGSVKGLSGQLSSADQQVVSYSQQVVTLGQLLTADGQALSNLQQQVSQLEQQTLSIVTETNTIVSVTTVTSTVTQTSISEVPESTLIVIQDSYSNASKTFTFEVQNTQNYTVYAQISASLWGQSGTFCNGQAGTYISQVYTFSPNSVTSTVLNLTLGQYVGYCGGNPVTSLDMSYIIPQSSSVSPTYTFNIVPGYDHS